MGRWTILLHYVAIGVSMKYGFSSYNSYDPLKAVLIGSAYPRLFCGSPDTKVADALCKVNDETSRRLG